MTFTVTYDTQVIKADCPSLSAAFCLIRRHWVDFGWKKNSRERGGQHWRVFNNKTGKQTTINSGVFA